MSKEITIDGVVYVPKEDTQKAKEKTVGIAIKNRFTGDIIFQSTKTTYREAVQECVDRAKENGTRANLTRANFTHADLTDANLTHANLTHANLTGADLTGADLTACLFYMGSSNQNFEALCKAIKTIKWNKKTGSDFIE